jgi:hypothetical protein
MNTKRLLSLKAIGVAVLLVVVIVSFTLVASAFTSLRTTNEDYTWEISRINVAEIEAQKSAYILAEKSLNEEERNSLSQVEKANIIETYEKDRIDAIARYDVIQNSIEELNQASAELPLSEKERIELISLNDEALDLAHRYELFDSISPDEEFQFVIDTLRSEGDSLEYFHDALTIANSASQVQSIQRQIFLAESYVALADDVQEQFDAGFGIDFLMSYITTQRERILAESYAIVN